MRHLSVNRESSIVSKSGFSDLAPVSDGFEKVLSVTKQRNFGSSMRATIGEIKVARHFDDRRKAPTFDVDSEILGNKSECAIAGAEPTTFRLLIRDEVIRISPRHPGFDIRKFYSILEPLLVLTSESFIAF